MTAHARTDAPATDGVATWRALATAAPRAARRARAQRAALAIVAVPGALWLGALLWWATRFMLAERVDPAAVPFARLALALGAFHLLAIVVATGPSVRATSPADAPASRLQALGARFGDRAMRLRALRRALVVELVVLAAQTLHAAVTAGHPPRFGIAFSIAVATLWVVGPLERIARASRREVGHIVAAGEQPPPA